jgi:hypothetical protein
MSCNYLDFDRIKGKLSCTLDNLFQSRSNQLGNKQRKLLDLLNLSKDSKESCNIGMLSN